MQNMTTKPDFARLLLAASVCKGWNSAAEIARNIDVSEQTLANWKKTRGISKVGILKAAKAIGCSATWLEAGIGSMVETNIYAKNNLNKSFLASEDLVTYDSRVAATILPKGKREQLFEKINLALENLNEDGLMRVIERIEVLAVEHPRQSKQTPSS